MGPERAAPEPLVGDLAMAVVTRRGRVLVQGRYRRGIGYVHEFPGGAAAAGETWAVAAARELCEETGLRQREVVRCSVRAAEDDRRVAFVVFRSVSVEAPRETNGRRRQSFLWFPPYEIPLHDFHAADRGFIVEELPTVLETVSGSDCGAIRIEPAVAADAVAVHVLHARAVRERCSESCEPSVIDAWLNGRAPEAYLGPIRSGALFVARIGSRVAGFGEVASGEIVAVYVDPELGGQGVGAALLAHAMRRAGSGPDGTVRLDSTLNAVGFYARHGFSVAGPGTARRNGVDVPVVRMVREATRGAS